MEVKGENVFIIFIGYEMDENMRVGMILIYLGCMLTTSSLKADIVWHWEDNFSPVEKQKVEKWLNLTMESVEKTLGKYPFSTHFYMHRKDYSDEPVPWAHTSRHTEQAVHFHIDPRFSLNEFLEDWTAPHEISHLSIPFLGKENAWFAEGYATYLQCQVMYQMGVYSEESMEAKYRQKFNQFRDAYQKETHFVELAKTLGKQYRYPEMYWGSVYFFYSLDQVYRKADSSLLEVIQQYVACCRQSGHEVNPRGVIHQWDALVQSTSGDELLQFFQNTPAKDVFDIQ